MPGTRRLGTAGGRRRQRALGVSVAALVLLGTLAAAALAASTDFRQPATSPEHVGIGPVGIVAVDLDGDTDRDLATANVSGGNVTILRNNGNGNFGEPASSPVPAGSFPSAIAAADLDGDTDQDLAVANQVSDDVTDPPQQRDGQVQGARLEPGAGRRHPRIGRGRRPRRGH